MRQTGTDTVRKLDLTKQVNATKKASGRVEGIGDRAVNKIMALKSEGQSDGRQSK
jgi:hypothetical protein